jgi:hypothetical protein
VTLVVVVVATAGLMLCGVGTLLLRRHRRFVAGRQCVVATVTGVADRALVLRLPTDESVTVSVRNELAGRWRQQLARGPGPFEEPDLEDPTAWDEVQISYAANGSPTAVLSEALEDARTMPLVLATLGPLITVSALLALSIPILLAVLGVATGAVAALLGVGLLRTRRGLGSWALALTMVVFLGGAAVAMVLAALNWG